MRGLTTRFIVRFLSVGAVLVTVGFSGLAQGKDIKHDDLHSTIQGESTSIQNAVGGVQTELTTQHGILTDDVASLAAAIAEIKALLDNLPGPAGPCEVPPVWGKTYALADRFVPVLGGAAFCDKATGLVWEGRPSGRHTSWDNAINYCINRTIGRHRGFHLPLIEQLASLMPLPSQDLMEMGPFSNLTGGDYWSATTNSGIPFTAWSVNLDYGIMVDNEKSNDNIYVWCVRGGQAFDGQDVQDVIDALP